MAFGYCKTELDELLNKLDMKKFYREKMSRNDLYQITEESLDPDKIMKCSPAWQFIHKITRYNYEARNIQTPETHSISNMGLREKLKYKKDQQRSHIHPLDIIAAVFLCCNPIARQDLVMHLWGCKLAVPLVLPEKDSLPSTYIWPLRSLIGKFRDDGEVPLITKEMPCIAFVRVGENQQYSKSYLLNCLIGGPEKSHPLFFHRNSEGSKALRSNVTNGMIEAGWFIPSYSGKQRFDGPRLFINLRGNATNLKDQVTIIGHLATVTIILTTERHLKETKHIIDALISRNSNVLLFISDENLNDDSALDFLTQNFPTLPDKQLDIVTVDGCMLSDVLNRIRHNIGKMETGKQISLKRQIKNNANKLTNVDESKYMYLLAFKSVKQIMSAIVSEQPALRKEILLPLQGKFWKEWSQLHRDLCRYNQLDPKEKKKYENKNDVSTKLRHTRLRQYDHFKKKGLSKPLMYFLECMSGLEVNRRNIFLRKLKLDLDNLSRKQLQPSYNEYQQLIEKLPELKGVALEEANKNLSDLETLISKLSFSVEDIVREVGQLYEACDKHDTKKIAVATCSNKSIDYTELPKYACMMLLEGYPIEILDGEACSVPLTWIRQVLSELPQQLQKRANPQQSQKLKVHIVSILGIQSSGKSTFLNTVFGLQFAVSAGRCTRGAFLQLVQVKESVSHDRAKFVLVIDTEGLKSTELISDQSTARENELSTFVIGLADTTIITLMGENVTYLQENLPIAVQAFLRMKLAGLRPRCTIVHQNVNKREKDKLLQQGRILESVLNQLTKKACDMEQVPEKNFCDIIDFSVADHIDYIPCLYEGEQNMAPISNGYSKESDNARSKLISFMQSDGQPLTLSIFTNRLQCLWEAIKTDRFVYEFRTTLEAEAKLEQDKCFSVVMLTYLQELDAITFKLIPKIRAKKLKRNEIEKNVDQAAAKVKSKCEKRLVKFFEKKKKNNLFEGWREPSIEAFTIEADRYCQSAIDMINDLYTPVDHAIHMEQIEKFFDDVNQMKEETKRSTEDCFNCMWMPWVNSLNVTRHNDRVLGDTLKALQLVLPSQKHQLNESALRNKTLEKIVLSVKTHLNTSFHHLSSEREQELINKLASLHSLVEAQFKEAIKHVRQRELPYSDRNPHQILMKIENLLSNKLQPENIGKEINNQFKIDILLGTAGSIIKEFKSEIPGDFRLEDLRKHMLTMALKKETKVIDIKEKTALIKEDVFNIIELKIMSDVHLNVTNLIQQSLPSCERIKNKRNLLGLCLEHMIRSNDEHMIKLYTTSPMSAVYQYLQISLRSDLDKHTFVPELQTFVLSTVKSILKPLLQTDKPRIDRNEVLTTVLETAELHSSLPEHYKIKCDQVKDKETRFESDFLRSSLESSIYAKTQYITKKVADRLEREDFASYLADRICQQYLGCTELCPFCREICMYSQGHIGYHECFVHKPVLCAGVHSRISRESAFETCYHHFQNKNMFRFNDRWLSFRDYQHFFPKWEIRSKEDPESSKIWKWIFVNKHFLLVKHDLERIPISWNDLTRKEVDSAIDRQFHIGTFAGCWETSI